MSKTPLLIGALVLASSLAACKKSEPKQTTGSGSAVVTAPADAAAPPVDAAPTDAERVAKGLAEAEEAATKEKARWTPELTAQAVALRDKKFASTKDALTALLASPHRMPDAASRDAHRHPVETLTFFGIQPNHTVIELGAGGGWYTELLAPLLANKGKFIVAGPDANGPADKMTTVYGKRLDLFLAKSPELFGKVQRVTVTPPDNMKLGEPGSADVVIAMREMHNWQRAGSVDAYLKAINDVLKVGGTLGIEQHRAKEGTKGEDTAGTGYLAEQWVIDRVQAAGFKLAEKSEINANPKDTKDYAGGVWTLAPNFREGPDSKAKYEAIGESDRMTLKFTKLKK